MKSILYFLLATLLCCVPTACGGNDHDEPQDPSQALFGSWRHDFSTGYVLMHFNSDGTGWEWEVENNIIDEDFFEYFYYPENSTITFIDDDGDIETKKVIVLTSDRLVLEYTDIDVETEIWIREQD